MKRFWILDGKVYTEYEATQKPWIKVHGLAVWGKTKDTRKTIADRHIIVT